MRTRFEAMMSKRAAVKNAESSGIVADSLDVRKALMVRVYSGEITLEQAKAAIAKIKRNAKKNGLSTRSKVFREA